MLTAVAAALAWLTECPPGPALLRVGDDIAAEVIAGLVDPTACVCFPGESLAWPDQHGVAPLAALVRRKLSKTALKRLPALLSIGVINETKQTP